MGVETSNHQQPADTSTEHPLHEKEDAISTTVSKQRTVDEFFTRIEKLNKIGIALSTEKDPASLMETILMGAKELTYADAGTLYSVTEQKTLKFEIIRTDSLNIAKGGTTGEPINFPELPLYNEGSPNLHMVAAYAALKETTVNIPDAYKAKGFDFSGTRKFDQSTGYRSQSFLTVPLKNHENLTIGVLQLINAKDPFTGRIKPFSEEDQSLAESLASQAAISMTNQRLITNLRELFEAFIRVIASAIDEKSPYTGGHCHRVPVITEMLAQAAMDSDVGELKDFYLNEEEMYELKIAAWLHDCGKVTTPEYVVDKATKLETIFDRIELVKMRFEVLKREVEIDYLQKKVAAIENNQPDQIDQLNQEQTQKLDQINQDLDFLERANVGGEFMSDDKIARIEKIAQYQWRNASGEKESILTENEIFNLKIRKGTLTEEEREVINSHVSATIKMLEQLPFPKNLQRVPELAGAHHEKLDGTGYPNGLIKEEMSIGARILAIADVFEALTARDRPYKKGKTISQALKILGFMKKDQHIDPDLFKIFLDKKIFLDYAEQYLDPQQIDEVDLSKIPGYQA
ncbi:HD domain-containing phosphohydrolase [Magnetococcales bacterium HHB-1]